MAREDLFISYSHADRQWLREFHTQLAPLVRQGLALWDDTQLKPGVLWRHEIDNAIARSKVALLLVSPDFLASDFIHQWELGPLLEARAEEELTILWVHVRACLYELTAIGTLQAAHDVARPLDALTPAERGAVQTEICRRVHDAIALPPREPLPETKRERVSATGPMLIRFALVLSGTIVGEDKPLVEALLAQLRAISRDSGLTIERIQSGSIHLTLRGTLEGFKDLQDAFVNGQLERAIARDVHAMYRIDDAAEQGLVSDKPVQSRAVTSRPERSGVAGIHSSNRLGQILPPGNVLIDVDATSKKRAFEHAGLLFEMRHGIARATVTDNLFSRERLGSTGLGHGVAIPHARIRGLQHPLAAVLRVQQPIPFDAPDDEAVSLLIFLLVPEEATQRHLAILSEIAEMLSDRELRESLKTEGNVGIVHEMIFRWTPLQSAA